MKTNIFSLIVLSLFVFASCEPLEDRDKAGRLVPAEELQFEIIQQPAGSNTIVFENKTSGIIPYFSWGQDLYSNEAKTEIYLPFVGEYTVTMTGFSGGGSSSISRTFTVSQNDPEYFANPEWDLLTGNGEGKTWVVATDLPASEFNGVFWGNGGKLESWFNWSLDWGFRKDNYGDDFDINGEFYFDLKGGLNFSSTENGTTTTGVFNMNLSADDRLYNGAGELWAVGSIEFTGATIPYGKSVNEDDKIIYRYEICRLTEDELVLAYIRDTGETWYWRFKRKGFNF